MIRLILIQRFFWLLIFATLLLGGYQANLAYPGRSSPALIINEIVATNNSGLVDEDGDYSDWIEIYNAGRRSINLAGWSLTDNPDQPEKWVFPDMTLNSGQYLVVFSSGKDRRPSTSGLELHTNFKLDESGEFLGLYSILKSHFVDTLTSQDGETYKSQVNDVAFGRLPGSHGGTPVYGYLASPTPGQSNAPTLLWTNLVAPLNVSHQRGFYEAPFTLTMTTTTPGATIRFTTDGSQPSETTGTIYTEPIVVSSTTILRAVANAANQRPSPVETQTYIFLEDVLTQPQEPAGYPNFWGGYEGSPIHADYEMDPEIVNDPRYRLAIKPALQAIPSLSIVTGIQSFHDLYSNPRRKGRAWERPVSVELITSNQPGFQINAGLRIQGELGRSENLPKHGLRLSFREEYGTGKLNYPLFPDSPVTEFDTLVLRSGVNRSYAGYPGRPDEIRLSTYTRDQWLRDSQRAMSGFGSRGVFVHLYLNGLYWGLYNVIERPDDAFMAAYWAGTEADWDTISHEETVTTPNAPFKALHKLAAEGQLEAPERYEAMKVHLDVPHFIDYLILNWYAGNLDWGFNNWYAGAQTSAGPVKYFVWDGERTWFDGAEIYMEYDEYLGRPNLVKFLFEALLANPDFKMELADRMHTHLFNGGVLSDTNSKARWLHINSLVEQAIIAESARWGDTRFDSPLTQEDWFYARDVVSAQIDGNSATLVALAREAGYYPEIDPPQFNRQGGQLKSRFDLILLTPEANDETIYYTLNGTDPRLSITGEIAPGTDIYGGPISLTNTTHIKARALRNGEWSALSEVTFMVDQDIPNPLRITEIMYNPIGGDKYEFIELKNFGEVSVSLANLSFQGISFTFPPDTGPLAPGRIAVLVRDRTAFAQRYPKVAVTGVYEQQLSNGGEKIILQDAAGNPLLEVEYSDSSGGAISADGHGDSLVLADPFGEMNDPNNWRASTNLYGSPGTDEANMDGTNHKP